MSIEQELQSRSGGLCELCRATTDLAAYDVTPTSKAALDKSVWTCGTCRAQIEDPSSIDPHHWRCLNDSMWSEVTAVQVVAWRMLSHLSKEAWARDLQDTMYLDEDDLAWAKAGAGPFETEAEVKHIDSNGSLLQAGDTVTLIKDLVVKGGGFTAKRGTAVRDISLVDSNAEHIEGRVNGQQIVILTKFVKKSV